MEGLGRMMLVGGVVLAAIGGLLMLLSRVPGLKFGNLPGDIVVDRPGFSAFVPITSMLIVSAVLSVVMWLVGQVRR
ncbi:MAG: DUF2905 domain-containing protein [Fimbriimonas sp.]